MPGAAQYLLQKAHAHFGPLGWWPGNSRFEICVGAILTQNCAWTNVEKAIANLKAKKWLSVKAVREIPLPALAEAVRPSGYYRQKAQKLKNFVAWLDEACGGSLGQVAKLKTDELRSALLSVKGIGPETADSILLYAFDRPVFVVDAYTKRIFSRHGFFPETWSYDQVQGFFMKKLKPGTAFFNQYHALVVYVGKDFCKKTNPNCQACPLPAPK